MRNIFKSLPGATALLFTCTAASAAVTIGLNPATPLGGYDLGGGLYATLIGVQSTNSLVGETVTSADLFATIQSGSVTAFYYAAGNPASSTFDNISAFSLFSSDTLSGGTDSSYNNRAFDSLYAVHSGEVVFSNGRRGTTTMSTGVGNGGVRIQANPFTSRVPDGGTTLALLGASCFGLGLLRRKLRAG